MQQQEGDPLLLLKISHEAHLVFMDVRQGKCVCRAFLCVEADRDALHHAQVVDRALLVKIGQSDMARLFLNVDGRDRRRNLLNQGKPLFPIVFNCLVDQLLQRRTPEPSRFPRRHNPLSVLV